MWRTLYISWTVYLPGLCQKAVGVLNYSGICSNVENIPAAKLFFDTVANFQRKSTMHVDFWQFER